MKNLRYINISNHLLCWVGEEIWKSWRSIIKMEFQDHTEQRSFSKPHPSWSFSSPCPSWSFSRPHPSWSFSRPHPSSYFSRPQQVGLFQDHSKLVFFKTTASWSFSRPHASWSSSRPQGRWFYFWDHTKKCQNCVENESYVIKSGWGVEKKRKIQQVISCYMYLLNFAFRLTQGYGQGEASYLSGNFPDLLFYVTFGWLIDVRCKYYYRFKIYVEVLIDRLLQARESQKGSQKRKFPNFKRHSIALYVNYPYKVKNVSRR